MVWRSETPVKDVDLSRYSQAIGCGTEVGTQGLRWATLWKEVNGARLGCFNPKRIEKRIPNKNGTCISANKGVLVAEEVAVLLDIATNRRSHGPGF